MGVPTPVDKTSSSVRLYPLPAGKSLIKRNKLLMLYCKSFSIAIWLERQGPRAVGSIGIFTLNILIFSPPPEASKAANRQQARSS
jgi:hypothetical protein